MLDKFKFFMKEIVSEMGDQPATHAPAMLVCAALFVVADQLSRIAETLEEQTDRK
jgi:hypothetical protein